ncbi:MAG: copper amine oxidase N-terminal domain-containing protein [Candidatus Xenobia bacterium]
MVDGQAVKFDVPPLMIEGTVYVPLRGVFEKMGAKVRYESATGRVFATRKGTTIVLRVGDRTASVNDDTVIMVQPAVSTHGRTLVPLRFLSEELGMQVDWDPGSSVVSIRSKAAPDDDQ